MIAKLAWLRPMLVHLSIVGLLAVLSYRSAVAWYAGKVADRVAARCGPPNQGVILVQEGPGYNPANLYWAIPYDCRHVDLEVRGVLPKARYWSLVPYDEHTLPLPSCLFDENVVTDGAGRYVVYLTVHPRGRPNELDVSSAPRGLVLIRASFPDDAEATRRDAPHVHVLR